jgi:hypothetical protein
MQGAMIYEFVKIAIEKRLNEERGTSIVIANKAKHDLEEWERQYEAAMRERMAEIEEMKSPGVVPEGCEGIVAKILRAGLVPHVVKGKSREELEKLYYEDLAYTLANVRVVEHPPPPMSREEIQRLADANIEAVEYRWKLQRETLPLARSRLTSAGGTRGKNCGAPRR